VRIPDVTYKVMLKFLYFLQISCLYNFYFIFKLDIEIKQKTIKMNEMKNMRTIFIFK